MREFLLCRFCQFLPCLGHVLTLREDVSDKPQTRADFLVPLAAPLHRQYKTARTETRWHLLLKIRQMPIQTSASRGYVLFSGANKGHSQKVLKLSAACGHASRSVQNLERHRSSQLAKTAELEIPYFVIRILPPVFRWNARVMPFNEQQRSDDLLSPAACLSLSQLFVLYEHLFNDAPGSGHRFSSLSLYPARSDRSACRTLR